MARSGASALGDGVPAAHAAADDDAVEVDVMVRKAVALLGAGIAIGVVADKVALELRKPAADQFPWLRERMNSTVNPWLLERGIPGSEKAEIATLEHVGRSSGRAYFTPVHPTVREETVLIPAPLGVGSQWAQNVVQAGRARMQLHERLYELDRPELITVAESGMFPAPVAAPFDRMGWRYVRFHVAASVPATFETHAASMADRPAFDASLDHPVDIPVEPRMVTRDPETAPA
jgi:hypothetical protein